GAFGLAAGFSGSGALAGAATTLAAAAFGAGAGAGSGGAVGAGACAGCPLPVVVVVVVCASVVGSGEESTKNSCQLGSTGEGSSRNLRYISSTNHSFCPNGDGEFTAATRLDSFASGKRLFHTRSTPIFPRSTVPRVSAA